MNLLIWFACIVGLNSGGNSCTNSYFFDTLKVVPKESQETIKERANKYRINLRYFSDNAVSVICNVV